MTMTRRQFARNLGAGIVLLPFLRHPAAAATTTPKRIIVMTSLGTRHALWEPLSSPGQALQLPASLQPLSAIAGDIVLVDGLSLPNPTEGHSTPATLTGKTFSNAYGGNTASVDQYIAQQLGAVTKVPSIVLGWQGVNEGQHWAQGARIPSVDSPVNAWQTLFGASTAPTTSSGTALPRQSILNLVTSQIGTLQKSLGSEANQRLGDHLDSITQLEKAIAGGGGSLKNCVAPGQPNLNGANPEDDTSTLAVANAHASLIVAALACDITRVVGMQWGVSNEQYLQVPNVDTDEHSMVHSGDVGTAAVIAAEAYLCQWFASLVTQLKSTADPTAPGSTLLDNTLILWARDIGDGPVHLQYAMPYVLAGGTGYLKTNPSGAFYTYGGSNENAVTGAPHQQLLLNLCDFMGVTNYQGFGSVSTLNSSQQQPLQDLKV